jgi:hypothetical protein
MTAEWLQINCKITANWLQTNCNLPANQLQSNCKITAWFLGNPLTRTFLSGDLKIFRARFRFVALSPAKAWASSCTDSESLEQSAISSKLDIHSAAKECEEAVHKNLHFNNKQNS